MATSTTNVPRARPQDAVPSCSTRRTEYRQVVCRVLPGSEGRARRLASIAGACRFVWNELLDQQEQLHTMARMCGGRTASPTFFTMSKAFTDLRRVTPWLQDMPYAPVRHTLKHQADAWRRFFDGAGGQPRFKRRGRDSVTIAENVRIEDNRLWFPRLGWLALRRRGGNPYPEGRPVKAVVKRAGGRWMATVCYEVEAPARADDGTVTGIDRNVRQVACCDGEAVRFHHGPDTARLEARTRRYQRRMARQRRGSNRREDIESGAEAREDLGHVPYEVVVDFTLLEHDDTAFARAKEGVDHLESEPCQTLPVLHQHEAALRPAPSRAR